MSGPTINSMTTPEIHQEICIKLFDERYFAGMVTDICDDGIRIEEQWFVWDEIIEYERNE